MRCRSSRVHLIVIIISLCGFGQNASIDIFKYENYIFFLMKLIPQGNVLGSFRVVRRDVITASPRNRMSGDGVSFIVV